jgi:TonB family protein
MVYLIQVIIYTALMYVVYILFLRNRPMHGFNRAYLLANVVLPFLLPFVRLQNAADVPLQQVAVKGIQLPLMVVGQGQVDASYTVLYSVAIIYAIVSMVILSLSLYQWYKLRQVVCSHPKEPHGQYTLVLDTGYSPGSWYKYIFLPTIEKNDTIIRHEQAHIRLRHTADLILLTLVQVCFWPNIFLLLIRKELTQVHEFQADAATGAEKEAYATLLLSNLFGTCALPSTHSFINHPLKRRIMMLNKKSKPLPRMAALLATGMAFMVLVVNIVFLQSCNTKSWNAEKKPSTGNSITDVNATANYVEFKENEVQKMVDKMPQFSGNLAEFLGSKMVYPQEAMNKKIEGKVFIQFVVDKDGSVVNATVLKSPDALLSAAAIDVVNAMPKWIPGETETGEKVPVQFTLPVMFKL